MTSSGQPDRTTSERNGSSLPARFTPVWTAWLRALASDAEAALGAALAFEALDGPSRDAFLSALEQDVPRLGIPRVAVFAPLLSVEAEPRRRDRIRLAMGQDVGSSPGLRCLALWGLATNGDRVIMFASPVYLDFMRLLSCRFSLDKGFVWVRSEPLVHCKDLPSSGIIVDGATLERIPVPNLVDEVARAVLAQRRSGNPLPNSLQPLLELFGPFVHEHEMDGPSSTG